MNLTCKCEDLSLNPQTPGKGSTALCTSNLSAPLLRRQAEAWKSLKACRLASLAFWRTTKRPYVNKAKGGADTWGCPFTSTCTQSHERKHHPFRDMHAHTQRRPEPDVMVYIFNHCCQMAHGFELSLGYIARPCLKISKEKQIASFMGIENL